MELVFKKIPSSSMPDFEGFLGWKLLFLLNEKPCDLPLLINTLLVGKGIS